MPTLNVSLTPELMELINSKVTGGMYHSASEVVREGLRLLCEQDDTRRLRLDELRREVAIGTADLDGGAGTAYTSGAELAAKIKLNGRTRADKTGSTSR
ncbi:MAG TPA: type II toxin-antitoxin system ParD family antitoxin [Chthonomonadaceae bacterium]|nr:type II toxin-antitoxin system ParD family antitoxin [Chthonomonadaceae bacterium]